MAWSAREKRQLLQLLQARRGQSEPDAAELARELPGRSEAEVRAFLSIERGWRRGKDVSGEGPGSKTRHGAWAGRARGWGPGHLSREERGGGAYARLRGGARWRWCCGTLGGRGKVDGGRAAVG